MSLQDFDSNDKLLPTTSLWRYMSLSAFFALLDGFAFFPSIVKLRQGDPMEGEPFESADSAVVNGWGRDRAKIEEWLIGKLELLEKRSFEGKNTSERHKTQLLVSVWSRELAKRRAVWCWHRAHEESSAMWSVYADRGVAVRTTLDAMRTAVPANYDLMVAKMKTRTKYNPTNREHRKRLQHPFLLKSVEFHRENGKAGQGQALGFGVTQRDGWPSAGAGVGAALTSSGSNRILSRAAFTARSCSEPEVDSSPGINAPTYEFLSTDTSSSATGVRPHLGRKVPRDKPRGI